MITKKDTDNIYKKISMTYYDLDQLYARKKDMKKTMLNYINRENKYLFVDESIVIGNNRYYLVFKLQLIK
jgi:hypothetical protein